MTWVVRQRMFAGPLFCCLRSCSLYLRRRTMVVCSWYPYIYRFYILPEVTWSVLQATDERHKAGIYRTAAEIYAFRLLQIRPCGEQHPQGLASEPACCLCVYMQEEIYSRILWKFTGIWRQNPINFATCTTFKVPSRPDFLTYLRKNSLRG